MIRFWSKVSVKSFRECWEWNSVLNSKGYGRYYLQGKTVFAHRLVYEVFHGDIGQKHVLHTCDNPKCVNPNHLKLGTHKQNMEDCVRKKRTNNGRNKRTFCTKGHKYTKSNTYIHKYGFRDCKICRLERSRKFRRKTEFDDRKAEARTDLSIMQSGVDGGDTSKK